MDLACIFQHGMIFIIAGPKSHKLRTFSSNRQNYQVGGLPQSGRNTCYRPQMMAFIAYGLGEDGDLFVHPKRVYLMIMRRDARSGIEVENE